MEPQPKSQPNGIPKSTPNPEPEGPWAKMGTPMDLPFERLPLDGILPKMAEFEEWNKRTCECPMPFALRKWHKALGRAAGLRLCCMARALESFMEMPEGTLYFWMETAPEWEWDVDVDIPDHESDTGYSKRGMPPKWILDRLNEKDLAPVNSASTSN